MSKGQRNSHSKPFAPSKRELAQIRSCASVTIYNDPLTQYQPEGKAHLVARLQGSSFQNDGTPISRTPMEIWEVIFEEDLLKFELHMEPVVHPYTRRVLTDSYGRCTQSSFRATSPHRNLLETIAKLRRREQDEEEALTASLLPPGKDKPVKRRRVAFTS